MTTNAEETILAIAKRLIGFSPHATAGPLTTKDVQLSVCAARKAFEMFGLPMHINAECCVNARTRLREMTYEQLFREEKAL